MLTKEFNIDNKKIIFIGTTHGPEKEKINFLREYISSSKPNLILVEGGFENAKFKTEEEAILKGWELGFVSFFAKSKGIPLKGNDPSNKECINFIESTVSKDLTFLYFILRNFGIFIKQSQNQSYGKILDLTIDDFKKDSEWEDYNLSQENFNLLFEKIFKEKFNANKEYFNYFNPTLDIHLFNNLSKKLSLFRDNFIKNKLIECIKENDKILIVKGKGHLNNYERVIGKILNVR